MISELDYILKFIIKNKNKPKIPFIASQNIKISHPWFANTMSQNLTRLKISCNRTNR